MLPGVIGPRLVEYYRCGNIVPSRTTLTYKAGQRDGRKSLETDLSKKNLKSIFVGWERALTTPVVTISRETSSDSHLLIDNNILVVFTLAVVAILWDGSPECTEEHSGANHHGWHAWPAYIISKYVNLLMQMNAIYIYRRMWNVTLYYTYYRYSYITQS